MTTEQYWNPTVRCLIDGLKNEPEKLAGAISHLISDIVKFYSKSEPRLPKEPVEKDIRSMVIVRMSFGENKKAGFMGPFSKS